MNLYGFPEMAKIIPEGKSGKWSIQYQVATEKEAEHRVQMGIFNRDWTWRGFEAGTYCVLTNSNGRRGEIMMSDTWLERSTNQDVLRRARGSVLVAGLGIGLIITAIAQKPEVTDVTVIETEPDVIALVEPHIRRYLGEHSDKLRIITADIFTWEPTQKYDVIYFDIWQSICGDSYEQTKQLHKRYRKYLKPDGCMDSWLRGEFKRLHFE